MTKAEKLAGELVRKANDIARSSHVDEYRLGLLVDYVEKLNKLSDAAFKPGMKDKFRDQLWAAYERASKYIVDRYTVPQKMITGEDDVFNHAAGFDVSFEWQSTSRCFPSVDFDYGDLDMGNDRE